jgi:uncharacterized protein
VYTGILTLDVLLGDVRSLKQKRALVRPLVNDIRRTYAVAVAEAGHLDLLRRAMIGVATVASTPGHCADVLAAVERFVAGRPELELLSARQRLVGEEDE